MKILNFIKTNRTAFTGGIVAALLTGLGVFLIGNISGYQGKLLLSDSLNGLNVLCNTIILASVTILTLLLTLLGISSGSGSNLRKLHYIQVLNIAKIDTFLLVTVLIFLQFFNIPIVKSDSVPIAWFEVIYWSTLFISSLITGMMVTVVLMLYTTISNMISIFGLGDDHYLISHTKENEEEEETVDIE